MASSGVLSRDSYSSLPHSKPTRYNLNQAAPFCFRGKNIFVWSAGRKRRDATRGKERGRGRTGLPPTLGWTLCLTVACWSGPRSCFSKLFLYLKLSCVSKLGQQLSLLSVFYEQPEALLILLHDLRWQIFLPVFWIRKKYSDPDPEPPPPLDIIFFQKPEKCPGRSCSSLII